MFFVFTLSLNFLNVELLEKELVLCSNSVSTLS